MKIGIIGSCAKQYFFPKETIAPADIDIVGSYDDCVEFIYQFGIPTSVYPFAEGKKLVAKFSGGPIIEAEIAWPESTSEELLNLIVDEWNLLKSKLGDFLPDPQNGVYYATPEIQYMLKMSHRYKKNSPHFMKTMKDIRVLRQYVETEVCQRFLDFYCWRMDETYNYSHPALNVSKKRILQQ